MAAGVCVGVPNLCYADDPDLDCCLGHYVELPHPSLDMDITLEKIGPDLLMSSKLNLTLMAGVPLSQS